MFCGTISGIFFFAGGCLHTSPPNKRFAPARPVNLRVQSGILYTVDVIQGVNMALAERMLGSSINKRGRAQLFWYRKLM